MGAVVVKSSPESKIVQLELSDRDSYTSGKCEFVTISLKIFKNVLEGQRPRGPSFVESHLKYPQQVGLGQDGSWQPGTQSGIPTWVTGAQTPMPSPPFPRDSEARAGNKTQVFLDGTWAD